METVFDTWQKDPEFVKLPEMERRDIYLNYFEKEMADDEFGGLPFREQKSIKSNFLKSFDLQYETEIPTTVTREEDLGIDLAPADYPGGLPADQLGGLSKEPAKAVLKEPVYDELPVGEPIGLTKTETRPPDTTEPVYDDLPVGEPGIMGKAIDLPFIPGRKIARASGAFTEAEPFDIERKEASISDMGGMAGRKLLESGAATEALPQDITKKEDIGNMGEALGRLFAEMAVEIPVANMMIRSMVGTIGRVAKTIHESTAWRKMTIPERQLVVQSLDDVIRANPDLSEGEILRRYANFKKEAMGKRGKGEAPLTEADTIDLAGDAERAAKGDTEYFKKKAAELKKEKPKQPKEIPYEGEASIVLTGDDPTRGVIIHGSTKKPGKYQMTYWDKKGFISDATFKTRAEAIDEAKTDYSFTKLNPEAFDKISKTRMFNIAPKALENFKKNVWGKGESSGPVIEMGEVKPEKTIPKAEKALVEKPETTKAKEPWEMMPEEYEKSISLEKFKYEAEPSERLSITADIKARVLKREHKYLIKQALSEGKPVPAEVLKDYPELKTISEKPSKEKYQIGKSVPVVGNESLIDLLRKSNLKNMTMGLSKDGSVWVRNKKGYGFTIKSVNFINPNKAALELGHGRMLRDGEFIKGKYQDGTIELQRDLADKWTVAHESVHMGEKLGFISPTEIATLKGYIKRRERNGKWDSGSREIGGEEDRAVFAAKFMRDRSIKGLAGRVLQKIADFIDAVVNIFKRTERGILRDIESGKMFERDLGPVNKFAQSPSFSLAAATKSILKNKAFKKWFGKSKIVDDNGKPAVVYHGTPFGRFDETAKTVNKARSEVIAKRKKILLDRLEVYKMFDWDSPSSDKQAGRELIRELDEEERKLPIISFYPREEGDVFRFVGTNDHGYLGEGFYFSEDRKIAEGYAKISARQRVAGEKLDPFVYDVYLKIENPYRPGTDKYTDEMAGDEQKIYDRLMHGSRGRDVEEMLRNRAAAKTQMLKKYGYDGVVGESHGKEGVEYLAFDSTQIKSIYNRGTFSETDQRILYEITPEVLKDYPELKPAPEKTDVALEGVGKPKAPIKITEDKTVKVEMSDTKAEDLTPKEQKIYTFQTGATFQASKKNALSAIDDAIKASKKQSDRERVIRFVDPESDATFDVKNTPFELTQFKKKYRYLMTETGLTGTPKKPSIAPKKKAKPKELWNKAHMLHIDNGWISDSAIIIKSKPPTGKLTWEPNPRPFDTIKDMIEGKLLPAEIRYYTTDDPDMGTALGKEPIVKLGEETSHIVFKAGKKRYPFNVERFNIIINRFPNAKFKINPPNMALIAYDKGEPVAVLMGMELKGQKDVPGIKWAAKKGFASIEEPGTATPTSKPKKPLITESQKKRIAKKKEIKEKQINIENAKEAKEAIRKFIIERRKNLNLSTYETNLFVNEIEKVTTKTQREVVPFFIERTNVPKELKRPDLEKAYTKNKAKLDRIALQVRKHFNDGWQNMKKHIPDMSAEQIENYVTHIWDLSKKQKRMVTNWFITQNRFLKKRYIDTLKEGIEKFGLKPRTLDIGEIIRIHDSVMNRAIENKKFVENLMQLRKDGVPLVERADKAPQDWVLFVHPALQKALVIPGDAKMGEKISPALKAILDDMGVAIGRRISPVAFGKPVKMTGQYKTGDPPEVRFQRFMSNKTVAHEIGHHLDKVLKLSDKFLSNYKSELYAVNKERIESLKGEKGKYGQEYAESTEEQIAEFFATLFTNADKAYKLAPNATVDVLERLKQDGVLSQLVDFDFEKGAKNLIEEQLNMMVKLPVKVHPDLEKPLKVIFDSRIDHAVIQAYELINGILKKSVLSLSLFHHAALGETGIATMGALKTANIYFNPVKIYKAMAKGEFDIYEKEPIAKKWIKAGLQVGATHDIPTAMIQDKLNALARKTKNIPLANLTTKFIATFNETWDKALWNYLHDTLKLYAAESLGSKIDAFKDIDKQMTEIAQFVNDTFGGQNWDMLMVSPKTLQIMTWSLLSADWTISTIRQALAPTGIGAIYKETKGLRRKLGRMFWIKAALYFGAGINMLNYTFRKWDEEKNPQYYKDIKMTFWARVMPGNAMGKKTYLFVGRYEDGTERYIRWGKQFRELIELFYDDTGFSPISATFKKIGGKLAPVIQQVSQIFTGVSPSGFKNDDIYGKKGWDKTFGIFKTIIKSPIPFASRNLLNKDREFHITDIAFPSSKGMTRYRAIEFFKYAIMKKDERFLKEVYQETLRNNLPSFTLFNAALTSLKAETTKELNASRKTIGNLIKAIKEAEKKGDLEDIKRLNNRANRMAKEAKDRETGIKAYDFALFKMNEYNIVQGNKEK